MRGSGELKQEEEQCFWQGGGGMGCISSLPTAILIFLENVSAALPCSGAALPRSGSSTSESGIATLPGNSGNRNFVACCFGYAFGGYVVV